MQFWKLWTMQFFGTMIDVGQNFYLGLEVFFNKRDFFSSDCLKPLLASKPMQILEKYTIVNPWQVGLFATLCKWFASKAKPFASGQKPF